MTAQRKSFGMSLSRILLVVTAVLLGAQASLISIVLYDNRSISQKIQVQHEEVMLDQFEKNVTLQLTDIKNLLLLLQMPDFNAAFRNNMNLRSDAVIETTKQTLLSRMEGLHLSSDVIDSIYFISENRNQLSFILDTQSRELTEIPSMRLDSLRYARLEDALLRNLNRFSYFDKAEYLAVFQPSTKLIQPQDAIEIESFLEDMDGRLYILDGSNNLLVILVLNERFLDGILPNEQSGAIYSLADSSGVLWSSSDQPGLLSDVAAGKSITNQGNGSYVHESRWIQRFNLRIVSSRRQALTWTPSGGFLRDVLFIAASTLVIAILFSFFFLSYIFRPFRHVSRSIVSKTLWNRELILEPIGGAWGKANKQVFTLRGKLMVLFLFAVTVSVVISGILYAQRLTQEVDDQATNSVESIGSYSATGIKAQAEFFENLANQIAVSRQFQDYLTAPLEGQARQYEQLSIEPLKMLPGLNEVSYLVLLDDQGTCIYSSIYSNNTDIFNVASNYLLDTNEPYWLVNYNDQFSGAPAAIVREIDIDDEASQDAYLLIVPKESAFQIAESVRVWASYAIYSASGIPFYTRNSIPAYANSERLTFSQPVPDMDWTLRIGYVFSDIAAIKQTFQQQLIFSITMVLMISVILALLISRRLTKPIEQLIAAMQEAESTGVARPLPYEGKDEIGSIITSYNRMIARLEEATKENIRVMEENSRNKIREKELLSLKTRAELNMLQAQVNPHFLYNTLAVIDMQSGRRGDIQTSRTVRALADLLRYSLSSAEESAPLEQEVTHARNYFTILQSRFGDGFQLLLDVPEETLPVPVMRFVLQPLIENAVQHGFEGWESGGVITVAARLDASGQCLTIRVSDNGVGMDAKTLQRIREDLMQSLTDWKPNGHGIGLMNIYTRLRFYYQGNAEMHIESKLMAGATITMTLPVNLAAAASPTLSEPV